MSFSELHLVQAGNIATVASVAALPSSGVVEGAIRYVADIDQLYTYDGSAWHTASSAITPPGSSTDNAVVRWDGTTGAAVQNSTVTISDAGLISGLANAVSGSDALNKTTGDATYVPLTQRGAASGVATLDSGGKVPLAQLPASLMEYQGTWNASTNTPTLADGTGTSGYFYRVNVAGTQDLGSGSIVFVVGDWVMYNGAVWQLAHSGADAVVSVAGKTGVVTLTSSDVGLGNVDNTSDATKNAAAVTLTNKTLTSPILTTPALGVATATSVNKLTLTAPASGATLTLANNSTLATVGAFSITLTASNTTALTLPTTGTLATLAGAETLTSKVLSGNTAATLISGSGTLTLNTTGTITVPNATDTLVGLATADTLTNKTLTSPKLNENVALTSTSTKLNLLTSAAGTTGTASTNLVFSTSPTLVTPLLGTPTSGDLSNCTNYPVVVPGTTAGLVSASGVTGSTTGTAIATGFVGEALGSANAGTGGNAYSTRSTTATTNSTAAVISVTLNKGMYLVGYSLNGFHSQGSTLDHTSTLRVGGTAVTQSNVFAAQSTIRYEVARCGIPVLITANSTAVAVYTQYSSVTTESSTLNELWAVRIA